MTKVSIISPVYNVEKHIINLIKSIKDQTYKNFELILVDDGSLDNSIKIAKEELRGSDIEYKIISKKNGGQSSARNMGFDNASGEYVCTIDSDDVINPNYVKNLVEAIEKNNAEVAFCDLNCVTDETIFDMCNDDFEYEEKNGKEFFSSFFMHKIEAGPYSFLISKKYLDKIKLRYNTESRYSEEFIFICNLLHDANIVVHVKQRLYNYCLRPGSVSTSANIDKIMNGYNEIIKSGSKYSKCDCKYCKLYCKYAIPRWIIATARFTAKNMKYFNYKKLLNELDYKKNTRILYKFPKLSIRIAAMSLNISPFFAYHVFKRVGVR